MAGKYPSSNDREFNLLVKITENTALMADNPSSGGVSSLFAGSGITLSAAVGDITISSEAQGVLDQLSTTQGAILYRNASDWVALPPGTAGQLLSTQGAAANPSWVSATGGAGDFNGPASSTDNAIVRFDGAGGKTGQNSAVTIADTTGAMTWATGQAASLTGGDNGASLSLGSGTSGSALVTPGGVAGFLRVSKSMPSTSQFTATGSLQLINTDTTDGNWNSIDFVDSIGGGTAAGIYAKHTDHANDYAELHLVTRGAGGLESRGIFTSTGNLLIGTTTDMSGSGGAKIAGTTPSTGVGTGALQVAGGIYAGAASVFDDSVRVNSTSSTILDVRGDGVTGAFIQVYDTTNTAGRGFVGYGSSIFTGGAISDFGIRSQGAAKISTNGGTVAATFDTSQNATFAGLVFPKQATTAGAPAYVKGAIYFDTTLNKLRVGGAAAWETITSL